MSRWVLKYMVTVSPYSLRKQTAVREMSERDKQDEL